MGYTKQIVKGFSWSAILNLAAMGISIIKIVILSRFIFGPTEFGVFGVGVLVLGILELITETGINVFLIQETTPLTKYLDTAWVISIVRGMLISLLMVLISYPIAVFFRITPFWTFILAFSLLPLLRGFINPAVTNWQKKLKFQQDSIYRFSISAIEDISIVILAIITRNIYSFIIGMLLGVCIEVALTFIFVKERPKLKFVKSHFKEIVNRGKWVTLAQVFDYLFRHTDDTVVGRLLNVSALGIYQNAYTLSSLPENAIAQQLSKVTFPVFVNIRGEKPRVKRAFTRTFWITLLVITPFGLALFFFSDPLIRTFLGPKWLLAIPVLRVLSLFGIARAMTNLFYPVFLAFKKQNYITITTLVSWVILGIFIIPMTQTFGLTGAAFSALLGTLAGLPTALVLFNRIFSESK